jgi:two-component system NarL family response regulator
MVERIRVLLVDDHYLMRAGLASVLGTERDFEVCAQANSAEEALRLYAEHRPDVTIMDLKMSGLDGVAGTAELLRQFREARVVILSNYAGSDEIYAALQAGACAYLSKTVEHDQLLLAVRAAAAGRAYLPPELGARLAARLPHSDLSPREKEVLTLVARGRKNQEIAATLGISEGTVKNHVSSIIEKLGVGQRTEAVAVAIERGLIRIE